MTPQDLVEWIHAMLEAEEVGSEPLPAHLAGRVERVQRYSDAGIFTKLDGVVLSMGDESEFQITVVQTRHAPQPVAW